MTSGTGKIDKVYEEMIKMEERFTKLEKDQQKHFEEHIEKAAASIIVAINKKIEECECSKEILSHLQKRKEKEQVLDPLTRQKFSKGWHPENLRIEDTPFYKL